MSRDWDKLRRQDRANKHEFTRKFRSRRRFRKSNRVQLKQRPKQKHNPPRDIEKVLMVETNPPSYARWRRTRGRWHCIEAERVLEWMLRVTHPEVVEKWLRTKKLSKAWLPSHHDSTATKRLSEEHPAVRTDSAPSGGNTVPSLNNATLAVQRDDQSTRLQGLEQNGITNPRCLIRGGVPTTTSS